MRSAFSVLLFLAVVFISDAQNTTAESYQLVNDINKTEKRKAIYMCEDVNYTWLNYLKTNPKVDKRQQLQELKQEAIIKAYIGGNKALWLKNLPKIKTWKGKVAAAEFVSGDIYSIDGFCESHDKTGFYFYSEPLFSEQRDKAIVFIWYVCSGLGISAHFYYCEKVDGTWKKVTTLPDLGGFVS